VVETVGGGVEFGGGFPPPPSLLPPHPLSNITKLDRRIAVRVVVIVVALAHVLARIIWLRFGEKVEETVPLLLI
jgi:hypothetical protein